MSCNQSIEVYRTFGAYFAHVNGCKGDFGGAVLLAERSSAHSALAEGGLESVHESDGHVEELFMKQLFLKGVSI